MTSDINFNWRFDEYEIRVHQGRPADAGQTPRVPIELVKWDEAHGTCFTLAWWKATDEGYELEFIGSRPFDNIDADDIAVIWPQLRAAQRMLDAYHEAWAGDC